MIAAPQSNTATNAYNRMQSYVGTRVTVLTLRDRYTGILRSVHRSAVWLELRDDCLVAITDEIVSVAASGPE